MDKEIDLSHLLVIFIKVAKRNIIFILLLLIASFAIGYFLYSNKKTEYTSSATIYWKSEFNSNVSRMVANLNNSIMSGDFARISDELNLEKNDVVNLSSISISPDLSNRNFYIITLSSFSEDVNLVKFEKGLFYYLKENPYIKVLRDSEINRYKKTLDYIELEKLKIDTLINTDNAGEFGDVLFRMNDVKWQYEHLLTKLNFTSVESFSSFSQIKIFKKYLLGSIFSGLVLTFLLIAVVIIKNKESYFPE